MKKNNNNMTSFIIVAGILVVVVFAGVLAVNLLPNYESNSYYVKVEDEMGRVFKGEAWCAPEDADFENAFTGYTIAEMRAQIADTKTYRNDLRIKLSALNQLYYSMKHSKNFNPKSYENIMLQRQIRLIKNDLTIAKHQLAVLQLDLFEYLNDKDVLYKKIRERRNEPKQ